MNKCLFVVVLAFLLLFSSTALVSAEDTTTVSVQPFPHNLEYFDHSINETVVFNLSISDVVDLKAWQAGLYFNPEVLYAVNMTEGPFLAQAGETIWIPGNISNEQGIINFSGCSLTGLGPGVNGSGILAYFNFKINGYGYSSLELTTVDDDPAELKLVDSNLKEISPETYDTLNGHFGYVILGDIDGDGDVDKYDFGLFAGAYGTRFGDPAYNPKCDLDNDKDVDLNDYFIFSRNYGKKV